MTYLALDKIKYKKRLKVGFILAYQNYCERWFYIKDEGAMHVKKLTPEFLAQWVHLRKQLWPEDGAEKHLNDGLEILDAEHLSSFLLLNDEQYVIAFADASIRHDYVNGCQHSPVVYLEGIFVLPQWRLKKCAKKLVHAVEKWGKASGCKELASDAELENIASHKMHQKLGFKITEKVVFFQKNID